MHLAGRTAIVTGAGRGIGREVALLLAKQGAHVVVNDPGVGRNGESTEERPADEVVEQIKAQNGSAVASYASVADHRAAGQMVDDLIGSHGKVDILVNTAGVLRERMIWNMSEDDFDIVIGVHLKGHWNMCHHAIKHMKFARYGRIVNFSSDAFKGSLGQCNYAAAKGGIISLTRSIAKEGGRYGIVANAICPSADTRMTLTAEVKANRKRKLDAGLITQEEYDRTMQVRGPEFIAPMTAYLASAHARQINGEVFHVEKGRVSTYYFGEERRALFAGGDGMFSMDDLIQLVPSTLMNGIASAVPVPTEPIAGQNDKSVA